jgi:hypothetical protein
MPETALPAMPSLASSMPKAATGSDAIADKFPAVYGIADGVGVDKISDPNPDL